MTAQQTGQPAAPAVADRPAGLPRSWLRSEVLLVFALSLGADGLRAAVRLIGDATSGQALTSQVASLNASQAPGRPWLDLTLQLVSLATGVVPVFLVWHFLIRSGERMSTIGADLTRPRIDLFQGAVVAAVIGGSGLGLYLAAHALGVDLTVVAESLPAVWWRLPVLFLSALQNAALEEVLVLGYLLHRLRQLGWSDNRALLLSATVRGSYHLYQGLGGFAGNFVMGLIFGRIYQRWGRVMPLLIAHTLIDTVAFIGYAELAGHVSWLPVPS
ncbi:MAG TPA: CPBP family intramembrane glutamic endopeptidase [Mycobacteriales bacterium]|nr:CPBP family intramembrane glutamic endopeptidase [Mycobacteriales bacterium]